MNYAIIAAGNGSRLKNEGFSKSKPLVNLNGETIIERLIRIFEKNNATTITIIINNESKELKQLLENKKLSIPLNIICKNTAGSLHSFIEIVQQSKEKEMCLSTVDSVFDEDEFQRYISEFEHQPEIDGLFAVTRYVEDEKPLWIATDKKHNIVEFSNCRTDNTTYVSGGIYCLRKRCLDLVSEAIKCGFEQMRSYQQLLIDKKCMVKSFVFSKIIDIDHVEDIKTAQDFVCQSKINKDILLVKRNPIFSPKCEEKDNAIAQLIENILREKKYQVNSMDELDLLTYNRQRKSNVISMARHPQVLDLLESWEASGSLVLNTPLSSKNCHRSMLMRILSEEVPMPKSTIISTSDKIESIEWTAKKAFWIKRADFQTMEKTDVIMPQNTTEANEILKDFARRGIFHAVVEEHIKGNVIKFYGVYGTDFFFHYLPKTDKYDNTINSTVTEHHFDINELHNIAICAAESLGLDFYGGDAIVDNKGNIYIIDINDFPSYYTCKEKAAKTIVQHFIFRLKNHETNNKSGEENYKASLKSEDTEEELDLYFYRPLGYRCAKYAEKMGITPNAITIASIFIGTIAGILFYPTSLEWNCLGMALLVLANTLDSTDGQLARMTNNHTQLGRILDGLAGDIWFICIYVALTLRMYHNGFGSWIWLLGSAAGASHIVHAAMADYYRNIHLFFIKGKKGSELDNSLDIKKDMQKLSLHKNFIHIIMLWFYKNYTSLQEKLSPKMQKLLKLVKEKYPFFIPADFVLEFRNKNKSNIKYTNILQFNTRVICLFACLFLKIPWLYFVFDLVVLNGILVLLIVNEERLASNFYKSNFKTLNQI